VANKNCTLCPTGWTSGYGVLDSGYDYTRGYGYQNPITNRCYYVENTTPLTYAAALTACAAPTPSGSGYLFPIAGTFEYAMAAVWTMGIRVYWLFGTYTSSTTWTTKSGVTFSSGGCTGFCQFWCQGISFFDAFLILLNLNFKILKLKKN